MAEPTFLDAPPFPLDPTCGDSGIYALESIAQTLGIKTDYPTLKALSGDAFKVVYGPGPVYEPMRDLTPNDFIRDALAFYGVSGRWLTGYTLDELWPQITASIESGWPVLTSNLQTSYHGYQLIVGVHDDPERGRLVAIQGAHEPRDLQADKAPEPRWQRFRFDWNGPVSSRARWAQNPIFLISENGKSDKNTYASRTDHAINQALAAFEIFDIDYSTDGLEPVEDDGFTYAGERAAHGLDAWPTLEDELRARPSLHDHFHIVWKVDALAQRLLHDRTHLVEFFTEHAKRLKGQRAKDVEALTEHLAATRDAAATLAKLIWNRDTLNVDVGAFQKLLANSSSLAYPLPHGDIHLPDNLTDMGYGDHLHDTPWGQALLMEAPVRWDTLILHVRSISDLEFDTEALLRKLSGWEDDL